MRRLQLMLFGAPRVEVNGEPVNVHLRKGLALLIYVAVTRQSHSRDALATLFWPEKSQQSARSNLRRLLYDLGQILGTQVLATMGEQVALRADVPIWMDVEEFNKFLAAAGLASTSVDEPARVDIARIQHLVAAADLYTADFMAGFNLLDCPEFDDWQYFQREALRTSFATLLQELVTLYALQSQWVEALPYGRRLLAQDPLDESAHRRLMHLYAHAGQMGAALRQYDECVRILREELEVSPEPETTELYASIRGRRFPPAAKSGAAFVTVPTSHIESPPEASVIWQADAPAFVPTPATPFVGRRQELSDVLRRLNEPDCRLLTLVGAGGIGKTRLALAVMQALRGNIGPTPADDHPHGFKDGSFFVPLQSVNAPSGIVPAIAGALGLQLYSGAPAQEQLLQFLREKALLLILDNFEHLLEGAAQVSELLAAALGLKVLVTSRESLKLQEEWFHPLGGMRMPPIKWLRSRYSANDSVVGHFSSINDESGGSAIETMMEYDAVQLFIQVARRAQATFQPARELDQIVHICRLVDGMPLAIELAASWLKVLSCGQIADEIAQGIDFLVARHQNVPMRHRSMRVVLEHSWQLLDAETRRILAQLSVFRGGFLHDAAAIAGANLMTLADLVDRSWIYLGADRRYQFHELLRQYAADHLERTSSDAAKIKERHAGFYLTEVARLETELTGAGQHQALDRLDAEIDNVYAAWMHAVASRNFVLIDAALHPLFLFFDTRSRYVEGEELFAYALHSFTPTTAEGATAVDAASPLEQLSFRLRNRLGHFHLYQGNMDAANACFSAIADTSQDPLELAFAYAGLGKAARLHGDRVSAETALQHSLSLARAAGDCNQMAESLKVLSDLASSWADYETGRQYAHEALALCRQLQRPDYEAQVLAALAWAESSLGNYPEAERHLRESLAIAEAIASPYGIALAINFLGWGAYAAGGDRLPEALSYYSRALTIWRQIGQRTNLAMCLADYALAAVEFGDSDTARRYAQEALELTEAMEHRDLLSYSLYCMGAALAGLNDFLACRQYLLHSLEVSCSIQLNDNMAAALYFVARLLSAESSLPGLPPAERLQKQLYSLELLAVIIHQPATWQLFRERAQRMQGELMQDLPHASATAAVERGKARTIAEAAAEFLQHGQESTIATN